MKITTIGLDVAKTLLQKHGVADQGQVVVRKQLRRSRISAYFVNCRRT